MSKKKQKIDIKRSERALLTDTLPYELPIFFTNANLCVLAYSESMGNSKNAMHNKYLLSENSPKSTNPLFFEIRKDSTSRRRLGIPHPKTQHAFSLFYKEYDHFIANACSRSSYSLRYPSRVATHYIDKRYIEEGKDSTTTEASDIDPVGFRDQKRWASSYFSYREYNLSHKFFDSDEFLDLEREFQFLMKLDVSRCFDSIYTHSIEWSMRGKNFSKKHLPSQQKITFESAFDQVMRSANWNETHGIIVGPEFSRVFAEIILQSADRTIERIVKKDFPNIIIRRYVDDYFIFSNDKAALEKTKLVVQNALRELNLHLNEAKTDVIPRPFVSKINAARSRIAKSLVSFFDMSRPLYDGKSTELPTTKNIEWAQDEAIRTIRNIAVETGTSFGDFSSFALSVIHKQLLDYFPADGKPLEATNGQLSRLASLLSIIRVSQFLFSADTRVNTSIKLARIYSITVQLSILTKCARAPIEGQILDGLRKSGIETSNSPIDHIARINHVSCVDLLLTSGPKLEPHDIFNHIGLGTDDESLNKSNYFQLISALFICRKRYRFQLLRKAVIKEISSRLLSAKLNFINDSEAALLLTDFIACPYIDANEKSPVSLDVYKRIMGKDCTPAELKLILEKSNWISFTDWASNSNLADMLERKELTPAYE